MLGDDSWSLYIGQYGDSAVAEFCTTWGSLPHAICGQYLGSQPEAQ
jgi:hypothetical protein